METGGPGREDAPGGEGGRAPEDRQPVPENEKANETAKTIAVAQTLAELTAGWTPAPGVDATTLTAARTALAGSIVAGKSLHELRARPAVARAAVPAPELATELHLIADQASTAAAASTIAIVRSSLGADPTNPTGAPAWARGAQVLDSFGPFEDAAGALHWVDLIPITVSDRLAFGEASTPFGVVPVRLTLRPFELPDPDPVFELNLGAGSVWFLASLLGSAFPAAAFTGFTISGGTLLSDQQLTFDHGVYVAPSAATLTLTAKLAPPSGAPSSATVGPDATAATITPPAEIEIVFTAASARLESVDDSSATAYGTTVLLHWTGQPPAPSPELPQVLIPCTASVASFDFATVASELFTPAGTAPITQAAWALPLAATPITSLPEAAGPGSGQLDLGSGASVTAEIAQPVAIAKWLLDIEFQGLFSIAHSGGTDASTTLSLWPEQAPSTRTSSIELQTTSTSIFAFAASPVREVLLATGALTAHLDRPLDTNGARIPFTTPKATAAVLHTQSGTILQVFGMVAAVGQGPPLSLALENALLGVISPDLLIVTGRVEGDQFLNAVLGLDFRMRWILPTLPDPYASSFDSSLVGGEQRGLESTSLLTLTAWDGSSAAVMSCALLTDGSQAFIPKIEITVAGHESADTAGTAEAVRGPVIERVTTLALLDLSTNVDLFGVALAPQISRIALDANASAIAPVPTESAPSFALEGMSLAFNGAQVTTFALPQVSWEPVESTQVPPPEVPGPIFGLDTDGYPLVVAAPDTQQLVPFAPAPVLANNIANVAAGTPFAALFTLPFGLVALIVQPNQKAEPLVISQFVAEGGTFEDQPPAFEPTPSEPLTGAASLTLEPIPIGPRPGTDPMFPGFTETFGSYGESILGSSVTTIFNGDFNAGAHLPGVPLLRIDFSGYGSSIFSEWLDASQADSTGIIKAHFESTRGRTLYEVIQAKSLIFPYAVRVVRTITMERQNAGWIQRIDSGWVAASPGQFQYPGGLYTGKWHAGPLVGAFNVRNIREQGPQITVDAFTYQKVLFDADLGIAPGLKVNAGGFEVPVTGVPHPPPLVASKDIVGYVQLTDGDPPAPSGLADLLEQYGPFTPGVSCVVEAGAFGGRPGTVLRCSSFEVGVVTTEVSASDPSFGVALHGAPQIPRAGGWSMAVRNFSQQSPTALSNDFPVPLVQSNGGTGLWHIANVADILSLDKPASYFSLMHATGTNKVLFEAPQIPTTAASSSGTGIPGLQFPKLPATLPGGVPNPGSPNLGDLASILNSTGLFPDLGSALSILDGELPQLATTPAGLKYSKEHTFDLSSGQPQSTTLIDIGVIKLALLYGDPTQTPPIEAELVYAVDSSQSPSWTLSLQPLAFTVTIPVFGDDPVLTITGGFYGDEHTKPGLTNLNVVYGGALSFIKSLMSDLQALASFLPGGAGANLDVAVSDGHVTVSDTFTINDLPLGFGDLTDISLDLGLDVTLSPLSVNFLVGLGGPNNPFNWIMTPLAGNGLINLGVQDSSPALIIQGGIGLGIAIDLGIASGSASITIAVELDINGSSLTVIATLTGQASVDLLDGLASASITLSASIGFSLDPPVPIPEITGDQMTIPSVDITLLAACSVGIHISICWVISISWDGSWSFSQSIETPSITVTV